MSFNSPLRSLLTWRVCDSGPQDRRSRDDEDKESDEEVS